jgi:ATP-binding protein involved in chromosome partitioning
MIKKYENNDNETRKRQMEKQNIAIEETLHNIKNKILVMSGKGGVGKSSVAAYLSVSLANRGYKVGLMDIDLHGSSIPGILGLRGNLGFEVEDRKMLPIRCSSNMEVMSIETLLRENKDTATIWRGL